jgi:photosystem II stability/assembly factor-like uncharacterized protein
MMAGQTGQSMGSGESRESEEPWPEETRFESAGCCGVIARALGVALLIAALVVIATLLITQPPNRWQGAADPSAHPLALITDPLHPQTVYVATEQGKILLSRDGGQRWQAVTQGLPANAPISALALLPGDTGLLAGTSAGVYRSADSGQTWYAAGSGMPSHVIVDAVSALPDSTLLAGTTSQGVWVTPGGSPSWQAAAGFPPQSDIYASLPLAQRGQALAALVSGGVYATHDDGLTWTESDQGMSGIGGASGASGVNVFSFLTVSNASNADNASNVNSVILAGTSRGIYASHDHGASWAPSSVGIGTTRVISLARDPLTPTEVVAGADTGVYQSDDGGATWRQLGFGLPAEQHVGAAGIVHPAGNAQVILASVDQLYRYPGQWPLATQPWRALALGIAVLLVLALVALIVRWTRFVLASGGSEPG